VTTGPSRPKRVQCWSLELQHATGLYKVHIVMPPTGVKAVVVTYLKQQKHLLSLILQPFLTATTPQATRR
jgi:hypothetical protein